MTFLSFLFSEYRQYCHFETARDPLTLFHMIIIRQERSQQNAFDALPREGGWNVLRATRTIIP